jgi:hypothetical protein
VLTAARQRLYLFFLSIGKLTLIVLPEPTWLLTVRLPPWASTICLVVYSPMPAADVFFSTV